MLFAQFIVGEHIRDKFPGSCHITNFKQISCVHLLEGRISDPRHSVGLQLAEWRSATEVADRCIETVHAIIEYTITDLRRAQAPLAKFDLLFEALGEIIVDVQRQNSRC